jgi:hypothetical protein
MGNPNKEYPENSERRIDIPGFLFPVENRAETDKTPPAATTILG